MTIHESDLYALERPSLEVNGDLRLVPTTEFSLSSIADLFTRSFEGSTPPTRISAAGLSRLIRSDSIDMNASRILTIGEEPSGFILVGTRGWSRRISAMGILSSKRCKGLGRLLMDTVVEDAREAGFRRIILEVFENNFSAVKLYRHLGFQGTRRLVGYERRATPARDPGTEPLKEMDPRELAKVVEYEAPPDLPWQLSPESIAASGPPSIALRMDNRAYALVTPYENGHANLETLLVPHAVRRQGWGLKMVQAIVSRYPGRDWRLPVLFPENLAPGFFSRAGFEPVKDAQLEMILTLNSGNGAEWLLRKTNDL